MGDADRIFHIADAGQWAATASPGPYVQSTRGLSLGQVGFIHCSTWEQVVPTAHLFYADVAAPLVVLEIDVEALAKAGVEVRWERAKPDDGSSPLFPHIYGALPTACVSRVLAASFDPRGEFAVSAGG